VIPPAVLRASVLALGALLAAGCQSTPKCAGRYEVQAPRLALYRHGPAQGTGPDVSLSQGDRVTVLESAHGYSRVALANGDTGYVSSTSLRPVPAAPATAAPSQVALAISRRGGSVASARQFSASAEPLFDVQDLPAPATAMTPALPTPRFRLPR
jgi:hypothetical protein